MQLNGLDHIHFSVPDLARAKQIYGPFLRGEFVPDYGSEELNGYGGWNTNGGDFIQPIDNTRPVFGGAIIAAHGLLSPSFAVDDVDRGIAEARAHGLVVRSRVGSEDIGLGKNVIQAQFEPEAVSGMPFEIVEHQLPGEYPPLTSTAVDHIEFGLDDIDAAASALAPIFGAEFEVAQTDHARGLRTRRHAALGLKLSEPLAPGSGRWQPGFNTVAFFCDNLDEALATARQSGLVPALQLDGEIDFEPWAGVGLRLVLR